ncbi:hypothetical protein KM043_008468 [Ampulex compressa]|nr:hypothetical protein KM043_008468 [Ampulex compressa]
MADVTCVRGRRDPWKEDNQRRVNRLENNANATRRKNVSACEGLKKALERPLDGAGAPAPSPFVGLKPSLAQSAEVKMEAVMRTSAERGGGSLRSSRSNAGFVRPGGGFGCEEGTAKGWERMEDGYGERGLEYGAG